MGYYLNLWTVLDPFILLPAIFLVFSLIGYLVQPLVFRVISGKKGNPILMGLVFTFGLALMFRGLALTGFGFFSHSIPSAISQDSFFFEMGSVFITIPYVRLAGLIYALAITLVLHFVLKKTDFGRAVRALSQHRESSGLMGINVKRISSYVYGIYVGLSAMTGVIIGSIFTINAQMGGEYTILAFFIVVLAGMGYLAGVPWAAFLLGLVQSFFLIYLNPSYTLMAVFGILFTILLISPKGLFGRGV